MPSRPFWITSAFVVAMAVAAAAVQWSEPLGRDPRTAIEIGMPSRLLPAPNYVAIDASMHIREDLRESGLILKHQLLRMQKVSRGDGVLLHGDTLIYTDVPELRARIDDVLEGRIPVRNGLEAVFAVGKLAPARIVRLNAAGRVESVEDVRASFVAFTIE